LKFLEVEALLLRRTTNGPFLIEPVSEEYQGLLVKAAAMASSHVNDPSWRFVLVPVLDRPE
jgi:hypothetical protein